MPHSARTFRPWVALGLLPVLMAAGGVALAPTAAAAPGVVEVQVLSGRADLVTDGNALVGVQLPEGTDVSTVVVDADDRDVTDAFVERDGELRGVVTDLPLGDSELTATLPDGSGATLTVINAPLGGPVFSGPLIEPWTCSEGAEDPETCERPATVDFSYMSTDGGGLQEYDPENPPSDVETTTTDEGNEVPFIVREETGVSLRDEYKIAALFDPAQGDQPDPTAANPGFNNKLVLTHGQSCDTSYEMGTAPDVLLEDALSRGFAVASHALDNAGHNCNLVTEAESLVVTKELVAERFGPLRYTIGTGCSGGSLVQQQVANAYPGIYQGILPQCSFTDTWSSSQQYIDFVALRAYVEGPGVFESGITPAQYESVFGHPNPANAITFTEVIPNSGEPTRDCPGIPDEDVYDENTNPDGVRCTLQDYMVNVFGMDDDGKARRPLGNTGIQYGLSGLQDGTLLPNQFVALNAGIGGFDLDLNKTEERTAADPVGIDRVYRSGAVNTGVHLDDVAIIDMGGPEPGAFHDVYRKYSMRDRLIREHGTADNQVFWEGPVPLLGSTAFVDQGIVAMDAWLAAIEADTSDQPLSEKVLTGRETAEIEERCTDADGNDLPPQECDATVDPTIFSSPRLEAGGGPEEVGFADDTLECQLQPLADFEYGNVVPFTDAQLETLNATFPDGVCDYSKPSLGEQDALTWLTYQQDDGSVIYGGEPLGDAPVSVPFDPPAAGAVCEDAPEADVTDRSQARNEHVRNVDCALHVGIADGTSATTYSPLRDVNREQMASFLVNTLEAAGAGSTLPAAGSTDAFDDIETSFHRDNINRLAAAGITQGTGDGGFDPKELVSRGEMASFVVRTARLATGEDYAPAGDPFGDVPPGDVHEDAVRAGFVAGLFRGTAEPVDGRLRSGTFSPTTIVPRDQMASFLVELFTQSEQ